MAPAAKKIASYEDVLAAPAHVVAELLYGVLHTHPRPSSLHAGVSSELGISLGSHFRKRGGGPGGWKILDEPELHLDEHVLVPDLAGWRRERMPQLPDVAFFELAPDWVCEVLSPSTKKFDRAGKLPVYASSGVPHVWLIEPESKLLEVFRLDGPTYRLITTFGGDDAVRAEPFEELELVLADLWSR